MNRTIDDDRFHPSPSVRASVSGDGLVLLDMSGGLVLSSNAAGARIWELLEQRRARREIARHLAGEYAIPLDRAERDVAAFVAALVARGLVVADGRP
ncbi:MAG TPA: PqqD family protein [Vicinamibacterales bacterium]|nr:PqqD family protein [Vicinamibacterales bacterium]